jgi:hypothetical protein
MAAAIPIIQVVGMVVGAGAAVMGVIQARKAADAAKKRNEVANRIAASKRARDIRRSVAEARIRRGATESAGFGFGVAGGSAVAGATGAQQSDLGSAVGASNQQFTGQQAVTSITNRISDLNQSIATIGSIGNLAGQLTDRQNLETVGSLFS